MSDFNSLDWQALPNEMAETIAAKAKTRRKQLGLNQQELAEHSGVSFGSIQRFEQTGLIALESLLKIAYALDCLEEFNGLFPAMTTPKSLDDLLK